MSLLFSINEADRLAELDQPPDVHKCERGQDKHHHVRLVVLPGLNRIIDGKRQRLGASRDVSRDHQGH